MRPLYGRIMPVIGTTVGFGIQVASGEEVGDAFIKTGAHVAVRFIGTAVVTAVIGVDL